MNNSDIIDLTDLSVIESESQPSTRKRNDRKTLETLNQPGTSRNLNLDLLCTRCKLITVEIILLICCERAVCYHCFNMHVKNHRNLFLTCIFQECKQIISDDFIKKNLWPLDYIAFLEKSRDYLRTIVLNNDSGNETGNEIEMHEVNSFSEFEQLQSLEAQDYVKNFFPFDCSVCFGKVKTNDGITLRNCHHSFCKECISETIKHSEFSEVQCPFRFESGASCDFTIEEREIRALLPQEIYEKHLFKGLKQAEATMNNTFHCKNIDCPGFIIHEPERKAFPCPICEKVNCIPCQTIHEEKTCEQYKEDLLNDVKNQKELKLTEEAVNEMIQKGEAMICPQCGAVISKISGCDGMNCSRCKLAICYATKKPRHPMKKIVNGAEVIIDGCHCRENGVLCHPNCKGCH